MKNFFVTSNNMIDGTRTYKGRNGSSNHSPAKTTNVVDSNTAREAKPVAEKQPDAANLDRRAWFGELIPAFGSGLVQLLRASNNLKSDLNETFHHRAKEILGDEPDENKK